MKRRGRPVGSIVRQNIVELLSAVGTTYGYKLHKLYCEIFAPCTREVIYYHLRTGSKLGEFVVHEIKRVEGDFSWGSHAEKIFYKLGPNAVSKGSAVVKEWVESKKNN
ncbi:hypothetical protein HY484_00425 [Candidatus Woesearchaeota archaeon]|nr:hypothetical protein [Candidatus Woesearchaeota archaeon]